MDADYFCDAYRRIRLDVHVSICEQESLKEAASLISYSVDMLVYIVQRPSNDVVFKLLHVYVIFIDRLSPD